MHTAVHVFLVCTCTVLLPLVVVSFLQVELNLKRLLLLMTRFNRQALSFADELWSLLAQRLSERNVD